MSEKNSIATAPRRFALIDAVIILALAAGVFFTFNTQGASAGDNVVVFRQNKIVAEYPLNRDALFSVNGQTGTLDIEIHDGSVRILHAECPRKICRRVGAINNTHGQLICAPNNILVRIRPSNSHNENKNSVDAIAY